MNSYQNHINSVLNKITQLIRKKALLKLFSSILLLLSAGLVLVLLLSLLESYFYFPISVRSVLFFSVLLVLVLILTYWIKTPIRQFIESVSLKRIIGEAGVIGKNFPDVHDSLTNALQLVHNKNQNESVKLTEAAFEDVYKKIKNLDFISIINYDTFKKHAYILIVCIFLIVPAFSLSPQLQDGASRLLAFDKKFEKPNELTLKSMTGNFTIMRGEDAVMSFETVGKIPEELEIKTKTAAESEFNRIRVRKDSNNIYNYKIRNVKSSLIYFAEWSKISSDTFLISVTSPPEINKIVFEITPPKYSKLPKILTENNGNITALKGTDVNFKLITSKNVSQAKRIYQNENEDSLIVEGNKITGGFRILKDYKYHFMIQDTNGNFNENPIEYEIKTIADRFPQIEINRQNQEATIPSNDIVNINYQIQDDFGFTEVLLNYSKGDLNQDSIQNDFTSIKMSFDKNNIEQNLFYNWELTKLNLRENDVLTFYMEVKDNDFVSGPKTSRTPFYKLRVPTLEELFAEADNIQESVYEELTETLKEAEDLQKEFQQIQNELKQNNKDIEWNEKERIQESVKKFEEIAEKIEDVQEKLNEMSSKLAENNLLSEETMKKYNELQELLEEMDNESLKEAFQNMQKSLENLLRDKVQESLENLSASEEMFKKSIERTLNLLKKIQIEQNVDEIIKRTEKLGEELDKISEQTENQAANKNEMNNKDLVGNQEKIENQLDNLESEMEQLESLMREVNNMPSEKMKEINEDFDKQMNQELSKAAKEQLQKQNPFDALKSQKSLSENMKNMNNSMKNLQQQMQQQSQQMVMQNMLKAIDNIISLSKEQEQLNKETEKLRSQPKALPEMANPQSDLKQGLESILAELSQLSQKTFAITPEMGQALGDARRNMNQSLAGMQNRNSQKSTFNQMEAMKSMNEAASMLQNSLQSMMQGGEQGGGMMSLMQQLQQMAQQQLGINNLTQMLKSGKLTMEQQAQLQRLAGQQAAIQKSLSELNREAREAGESKKLSANLEAILDDMKEVISSMNTQKVDDNLVQTQDKILSKLLDAQRSINERDFEKNRESYTGKDFNTESPAELLLKEYRDDDVLREELLKSFQSGFSKDYEDIIRRYFEKLSNQKVQN